MLRKRLTLVPHLKSIILPAPYNKQVIPAHHGATKGKGENLYLQETQRRFFAKTVKTDPTEQINDSTPALFDHYDPQTKKDVAKAINFPLLVRDESKFPPVPEIDYRKLNNAEWIANERPLVTVRAMENTEIDVDLFKHEVETIGFKEDMEDSLRINLHIAYPSEKNDFYYDSVLLGNYLECQQTVKKPQDLKFEALNENDLYSLIMITPDYPFRLKPEGNYIHWMVANIPGGDVSKGDTIFEYLPPIPTEYAGTFRYIFLLHKQEKEMGTINVQKLKEQIKEGIYREVQEHRIQEQVSSAPAKKKEKTTKAKRYKMEQPHMKYKGYEYEKEYLEDMRSAELEGREDNNIDFEAIQYTEYVPPPPPKTASPQVLEDFNARRRFALRKFLSEEKLSHYPVGISFFRTEFDPSVTETYHELGIQEPFYLPPDLKRFNLLKKKKTKVEKYFHRDQWV